MPDPADRFLRHRAVISHKSALGRVFGVTRQTWRLTDDPQRTRPRTETVATHSSASDAADLAREAAEAFPRHGFHKPSGSWWGADEAWFHRFLVKAEGRRKGHVILLASGLAALAVGVLARRRSRT